MGLPLRLTRGSRNAGVPRGRLVPALVLELGFHSLWMVLEDPYLASGFSIMPVPEFAMLRSV